MKGVWRATLRFSCLEAWLLVTPCPAYCELIPEQQQVVVPGAGAVPPDAAIADRSYGADFRLLPKKQTQKVEADTAHLLNGDKVSGVVERMSDQFLLLRSELLPEAVRIPLENVRRILFKEKERSAFRRDASAIFVNGDSLSIKLKGYDGEEVLAETSFSNGVRIKKKHLAGIAFGRQPRIIYKADFEEGDWCGFKAISGEWGVSGGRFGPSGDRSSDRAACLELRQEGHVRYDWEMDTEDESARYTRFLFFAQAPDHNAPGSAYEVRVPGRTVYLYRTIQNNIQHVAWANLSSNKNSRRFEVDCDSQSGTIRLKVDGEEVIAGVFSSPMAQGQYVLLATWGKQRFDDIVIRQVKNAFLPMAGEGGDGQDLVCSVNGDRLSGEVVFISEGKLGIETAYSGQPVDVPVEEVSSLRFGGPKEKQDEELPMIFFRNGDRLTGEVIALEESVFRVRSPHLGDVEIDVNDVASVVFRSESCQSCQESFRQDNGMREE